MISLFSLFLKQQYIFFLKMLPEAVHICTRSVMWLVFCLATRNVEYICVKDKKLVCLFVFCFITWRMVDLHEAAHLTDVLFFFSA